VSDLLPASFAALGAVVGFIVGATVGTVLWVAAFSLEASDVVPIVVGGLGGAVVFAWLGLRISGRIASRSAKAPS
jgi:hypothetical protein